MSSSYLKIMLKSKSKCCCFTPQTEHECSSLHSFEHSLVNELGYNGYERLRRAFNKAFGGVENVPIFKQVVDAGCGTGLVGAEFRNISQYLVGADLSPSIIEEAKKARPNLYNETKVGDVAEIFISMKNSISLIIAADSYIYFGDLAPLFSSMETGLVTGGFVAFTLENVSQDNEKRSVLIQYLSCNIEI
jgi:predicted TPR repeat methyltransferase